LLIATQQTIDETRVDQRFTGGEIRRIHQLWLGEIYEWAGEYRGVNIAKGAFMFAAAIRIYAMQLRYKRRAGNCFGDRAYRAYPDSPLS
jgi:cell filamentation protein